MTPILLSNKPHEIEEFIKYLIRKSDNNSILMPAFSRGYKDGFIDLDQEKSTTGLLSNKFLELSQVRRTVSAFFSFAVLGSIAEDLINLRPKCTWGEGSLYEYLYNHDAVSVTIGLDPYVASTTHLAEYRQKDRILYREEQLRVGVVRHEKLEFSLKETLLSRRQGVVVDFKKILQHQNISKLQIKRDKFVTFARWDVKEQVDIAEALLIQNPNVFIKNYE
jgi:aminoglycoside N3'-acetyltransferase